MDYLSRNTDDGIIDKLILFLYFSYFVLVPFYSWRNGMPQLSEVVLVLLIIVYIFKKNFKLKIYNKTKTILITSLIFITYIIFVNNILILNISSLNKIYLKSFFYIFNFIVFALVISLHAEYKDKILKITYNAILTSLLIQIIIFIFEGGFTGKRMIMGFNNPNQLGYYALLMLSLLIYLSRRIRKEINPYYFVGGVLSTFILVLASLSSTAIIAYLGMFMFFLFSRIENKKFKKKVLILTILFILIIVLVNQTTDIIKDSNIMQGLKNRSEQSESKLNSLSESRGYYRIIEYPEYWVFGSGEGEYIKRFGSTSEFHSTLGNIQVSYGIVGLALFIRILYLSLKPDNFESWYLILFILFYGITHNGIRNGLLWILFALMIV